MIGFLTPGATAAIWSTMEYKPGTKCTINASGDITIDAPCREFIGQPCEVVKRTKGGLIEVRLITDRRRVMSFPPRNVEIINE